jgi:hypothetical protein
MGQSLHSKATLPQDSSSKSLTDHKIRLACREWEYPITHVNPGFHYLYIDNAQRRVALIGSKQPMGEASC